MAKSMQHLNGDLMCVIDTETTGLDPYFHEICQVCILPIDSNFEPIKTINPFYIEIQPEYPERINEKAMTVNRLNMAKIGQRGFTKDKAADLLEKWVDDLGLPFTKFGRRKRIMPLGQNYTFDKAFIQAWIGASLYDELFHYHYRDSMIAACYLNDRASFHAETVPFSKVGLAWLAKKLSVDYTGAHDALQDCLITAQVYKKMMTYTAMDLLG